MAGNSRYISRATTVPAVPGAFGDKPEPKPKANRCIGLLNIALFEFMVILRIVILLLVTLSGWLDRCEMLIGSR